MIRSCNFRFSLTFVKYEMKGFTCARSRRTPLVQREQEEQFVWLPFVGEEVESTCVVTVVVYAKL